MHCLGVCDLCAGGATRTLAQEYGRIATIEELSEFTHMDIEEINQYVDLSHNEIELGKGENERK